MERSDGESEGKEEIEGFERFVGTDIQEVDAFEVVAAVSASIGGEGVEDCCGGDSVDGGDGGAGREVIDPGEVAGDDDLAIDPSERERDTWRAVEQASEMGLGWLKKLGCECPHLKEARTAARSR